MSTKPSNSRTKNQPKRAPKNPAPYTNFENRITEVFNEHNLSPAERWVFVCLVGRKLSDQTPIEITCTVPDLLCQVGGGKTALRSNLAKLESKGLIEIYGNNGARGGATYFFPQWLSNVLIPDASTVSESDSVGVKTERKKRPRPKKAVTVSDSDSVGVKTGGVNESHSAGIQQCEHSTVSESERTVSESDTVINNHTSFNTIKSPEPDAHIIRPQFGSTPPAEYPHEPIPRSPESTTEAETIESDPANGRAAWSMMGKRLMSPIAASASPAE